ncbi:hypothetical protein EVAR_15739_1 [Eumeta japonica]|uniref:Uncharacterized protein n=1 Tax=Eumeta variegata TaxID=151549 RepID=A0A4C1Z9L2_EUMVA|nr:hypothetical protein EVAR_15739_1 [Eumeta japonica]
MIARHIFLDPTFASELRVDGSGKGRERRTGRGRGPGPRARWEGGAGGGSAQMISRPRALYQRPITIVMCLHTSDRLANKRGADETRPISLIIYLIIRQAERPFPEIYYRNTLQSAPRPDAGEGRKSRARHAIPNFAYQQQESKLLINFIGGITGGRAGPHYANAFPAERCREKAI